MAKEKKNKDLKLKNGDQDWEISCIVCGEKPTLYPTGLCGPCCTGEAEAIGGNW